MKEEQFAKLIDDIKTLILINACALFIILLLVLHYALGTFPE